jgi:hypothetical protein
MTQQLIRMIPNRKLGRFWETWITPEHAELLIREAAAIVKDGSTIIRIYNKKTLRRFVLERDGNACVYCGRSDIALTLDHVVPRSKGGCSTPMNTVAACEPCNLAKGSLDLDEFLKGRPAHAINSDSRPHQSYARV